MKKLWLLSPFILSMLVSPLFGDEEMSVLMDNNEIAKCTYLGQKRNMNAERSESEMDYRLPADFWGVDTFAEYLIWQVQEQASYFTVNDTPLRFDPNYPDTYAQGHVRSQAFDWSSGVRVGAGYSFGRDVWQVLGQYTWYTTSGQSSFGVNAPLLNTFVMPTLTNVTVNGPVNASSNSDFSYQMADLTLASAFLATKQIQFNYSFGATGGFIKEHWNVQYHDAGGPGTGVSTYNHNDWAFGGGGLRAGLDTNWHVGRGFGFFGKVSFAAVLGQYTNHERITNDTSSSTAANIIANSTYQGIMLLPTSQFILGADWCRTFSDCSVSAIRISIAGELNHLSDLQQVFKTTYINTPTQDKNTTRDVGSVYMYGGTAHFGIDY